MVDARTAWLIEKAGRKQWKAVRGEHRSLRCTRISEELLAIPNSPHVRARKYAMWISSMFGTGRQSAE